MLADRRSFIFGGVVGGVHDTVLTSVLLSDNAIRWGWGLASPTRFLLHQDPITGTFPLMGGPPQQPLGLQRPRKQIRIPGSGSSPPPPPNIYCSLALPKGREPSWKSPLQAFSLAGPSKLKSSQFLGFFFNTQCNINVECCCRFCEIWRKSTSLAFFFSPSVF